MVDKLETRKQPSRNELIEELRHIDNQDKKLSSEICKKINPSKAGIIIPEIAKKIKEKIGIEDWNNATEEQLKKRTQIQKDIILLCKTNLTLNEIVGLAIDHN